MDPGNDLPLCTPALYSACFNHTAQIAPNNNLLWIRPLSDCDLNLNPDKNTRKWAHNLVTADAPRLPEILRDEQINIYIILSRRVTHSNHESCCRQNLTPFILHQNQMSNLKFLEGLYPCDIYDLHQAGC